MNENVLTNSDLILNEVINLISGFEVGDFNRTISKTEDPKLKPIIEKLISTSKKLDEISKKNTLLENKNMEDKARLDALFTQSADAIMILSPPNWKFSGCNPAALKLFEIESEELFLKLGPWNLSPLNQPDGMDSADKAKLMIQIAMEKGSQLFDWTHLTRKGKQINCKVLLSRINIRNESYLQATVRDVTSEQIIVNALSSKTEELNNIYINAPLGIIELDSQFRIVRCNPAYQKILEYSENELMGHSIVDFTHPEDISFTHAKKKLIAQLDTNVERFEKRYITKSGKTVWARITTKKINSASSNLGYLSIIEDVSEHKNQELETNTILETMADGLVIQEKDGKIINFNQSALKLLGLTEDQLLGRTSLDPRWKAVREDGSLYPGEEHPAMVALKTGQSVKDALMGLTLPNGKNTWIRINAVPYTGDTGPKVVCTFSDVTELLNAQSEVRFVLDALKIGVWKFNPNTQELYWDKSMYEVFDLKEENFTGHYQAWESALTSDSKSRAVQELEQALRGEKEFNTIFEIDTQSKGRRFISGQGTVTRDQDENAIMMYGINIDVTEQVKMKKDLELEREKSLRNAKLASLGEMSAGIAHEINNPLAIISGSAGLLSKLTSNPEKHAARVETIKKSCDRIARIVTGLRKFSRTGDKSNVKLHNLSAVTKEAIILTEIKSKRHLTPIQFECKSNIYVMCDEIEIEQVLVNLINNSIDAVKNNSEKWVKIELFEDSQNAVIRVTDSGTGIPESVRNKLFDPFFTTKNTGEGTGLGLSIVKGILDEHKASIAVLSDSPNTCFEIKFQIAVPAYAN